MLKENIKVVEENEEEKRSILKNKNFIALFIAALFSAPGYYVYLIGVEWLMLTIDDNRFFFGMLFIAASIPRLLLLTLGGIVADRFNKRTIVFISDITRALLIGILMIFILTDTVTAYHLIVLAMFFGISDAFSYPAISSLTPMILEGDQLQKGNSLIQMTTQISPILGPALGGSLIAFLGFIGVFSVAAGMLILSGIAILFIRIQQGQEEGEEGAKASAWEDLKAGFAYMRSNDLMVTIVILAFFINFFFAGPLAMGLPILVKDIFEADVMGLATIETSMGVGALLGALILTMYKLKRPGFTVVITLTGLGILYTLTGISGSILTTAALVGSMGLLTQMINIPIITMMQQVTDRKMLGRMMSFFMTVSTGLVPVSYLVTSILIGANVNIQNIMLASGLIITVLALFQFRNKKILQFSFTKEGN